MKIDFKLVAITLVSAACVGAGLVFQHKESPSESVKTVRSPGKDGFAPDSPRPQKFRVRSERSILDVNITREKPNVLELDDEEQLELTELSKKVLAALQAALDDEDFGRIQSILAMVKGSPKGSLSRKSEGMPVFMRKKMIEAAGWFGAQSLPELVEFLGDVDSDVAEAAAAQFELALEDISLGDKDRAQIVSLASKAIHDSDTLERIFMEISNMRNSVAAQTLVDICQQGTEEARALMPETIEFITGEENITTVEGLQQWLDANPDGEYDDDLYGPMDVE